MATKGGGVQPLGLNRLERLETEFPIALPDGRVNARHAFTQPIYFTEWRIYFYIFVVIVQAYVQCVALDTFKKMFCDRMALFTHIFKCAIFLFLMYF